MKKIGETKFHFIPSKGNVDELKREVDVFECGRGGAIVIVASYPRDVENIFLVASCY